MQQIPENILKSDYHETLRYNRLLQINTDIGIQRCSGRQRKVSPELCSKTIKLLNTVIGNFSLFKPNALKIFLHLF